MSEFNPPIKNPDGRVIRRKENEVEADFVEIENREISKRSQPSALAQIGQAITISLLNWIEHRLASNRTLPERARGVLSDRPTQMHEDKQRADRPRFGNGMGRRGKCRRFGNRPHNRRKWN